jgi:hypothetical protein
VGAEQLTLVGMLVAGIGSVSGALVTLWKKFEREARECQEDRKSLWKEIAVLKGVKNAECDTEASKS